MSLFKGYKKEACLLEKTTLLGSNLVCESFGVLVCCWYYYFVWLRCSFQIVSIGITTIMENFCFLHNPCVSIPPTMNTLYPSIVYGYHHQSLFSFNVMNQQWDIMLTLIYFPLSTPPSHLCRFYEVQIFLIYHQILFRFHWFHKQINMGRLQLNFNANTILRCWKRN